MAATVTISESNGAGETPTPSITNSNMGSADEVNLVALTHPITAGTCSFNKYQRLSVAAGAAGGSSQILNFKVWASAVLSSGCALNTNVTTSAHAATPYATPTATDQSTTTCPNVMPTSTPASANLTVGGSLTDPLDITGGPAAAKYSDYMVMQIKTTVAAVAGTSVTMNYQYDEVA